MTASDSKPTNATSANEDKCTNGTSGSDSRTKGRCEDNQSWLRARSAFNTAGGQACLAQVNDSGTVDQVDVGRVSFAASGISPCRGDEGTAATGEGETVQLGMPWHRPFRAAVGAWVILR